MEAHDESDCFFCGECTHITPSDQAQWCDEIDNVICVGCCRKLQPTGKECPHCPHYTN